MKPHGKGPEQEAGKDEQSLSGPLAELEKKLFEETAKAEEFRGIAQRVQAEFENFLKRSEKEKKEFREVASAKVIEDMLAVLDSFEQAIFGMKKHGNEEGAKGLELLNKQLFSALQKHGLKKIEAVGKKFDPHLHDCYISEHVDGVPDETVTGEIQSGYLLNSRVLRSSKVKINRLHEKKEEEQAHQNETGKKDYGNETENDDYENGMEK